MEKIEKAVGDTPDRLDKNRFAVKDEFREKGFADDANLNIMNVYQAAGDGGVMPGGDLLDGNLPGRES